MVRKFEIWITDAAGKLRTLRWQAIDLTVEINEISTNLSHSDHFCPFLKDGIHVRPYYLECFLLLLKDQLKKDKKQRVWRKNKGQDRKEN